MVPGTPVAITAAVCPCPSDRAAQREQDSVIGSGSGSMIGVRPFRGSHSPIGARRGDLDLPCRPWTTWIPRYSLPWVLCCRRSSPGHDHLGAFGD